MASNSVDAIILDFEKKAKLRLFYFLLHQASPIFLEMCGVFSHQDNTSLNI